MKLQEVLTYCMSKRRKNQQAGGMMGHMIWVATTVEELQ